MLTKSLKARVSMINLGLCEWDDFMSVSKQGILALSDVREV